MSSFYVEIGERRIASGDTVGQTIGEIWREVMKKKKRARRLKAREERERERDRAEEEWGGVPFAQPACVSNVEKQFVPLSTNGVNFDRNAKVADNNVKIALY